MRHALLGSDTCAGGARGGGSSRHGVAARIDRRRVGMVAGGRCRQAGMRCSFEAKLGKPQRRALRSGR